MKNLFLAVAVIVLGTAVYAGEGPAKAQAPVKPVAKAEPKTVLVPTTVLKKETVLVPKTVVKKETVMVPVKVVECDSCCEVASLRGRVRNRVGLFGNRVRGVAAGVCDCAN